MRYYLDKSYIMRLAFNAEVGRRGQEYFNNGNVTNLAFDDNNCKVFATVKGNFDSYTVELTFTKEGFIKKTSCNCKSSVWGGACKHSVAALLHMYELIRRKSETMTSKKLTQRFLMKLEQETYNFIDAAVLIKKESNLVKLVPTIELLRDKTLGVFLTLGRARQYVVKNISEFLEAVAKEKTVVYGKGLEFEHQLSMFDSFSRKLIEILMKEAKKTRSGHYLAENPSGRTYGDPLRCIKLSKTGLDAFFTLIESNGKRVGSYNSGGDGFIFTSEAPGLKFTLKNTEQGIMLSCKLKEFIIIEGYNCHYLLEGNKLVRLNNDICVIIEALFNLFSAVGSNEVVFYEAERKRFIDLLYPKLKDFDLLSGDTLNISDFEEGIIHAESEVYLDSRDGKVSAKLLFHYGNEKINPLLVGYNDGLSRNIYDEYRLIQYLKHRGFAADEKDGVFILAGDNLIFDFAFSEEGISSLKEMAEVYYTDAFRNITEKRTAVSSFGIKPSGELLRLEFDVDGIDKEDLMDVLRCYEVKKKYIRLKDGSFFNLEENPDLDSASELVRKLGLGAEEIMDGSALIPKYRALTIEEALSERDMTFNGIKTIASIADSIRGLKDSKTEPPSVINKVLREYQRDGFSWLKQLSSIGFGGILADDMGLGKTIQIIALLLDEKESGSKPSIVVAPTSLIYNWEKEIMRFAPSLNVLIIAGNAEKRKQMLESGETPDVYVTTYDTLKRDIDIYDDVTFRYIIADEAQAIKNPSTQNSQAVKQLKGEARFALTGTPIQNSLSELWSIFNFIMPGYLYDYKTFSKLFEQPIVRHNDKKASAALRKQVSPFILRRIKSDVLKELPDKIETTMFADMTEEQRKLYLAYFLKAKGAVGESVRDGSISRKNIDILAHLTRLRQICCHPSTFVNDYGGGSGKLDLTVSTIVDAIAAQHRILVFSQFVTMLEILRQELSERMISYFYLEGATDAKERLAMTERFNAGEKKVFLISLKAGGSGINLTGADVVIHYDPWWNPAVMDQATDRAHRYGQDKVVHVINIVAKDSIEEKMLKLQADKRDLIDNIVREGTTALPKLSTEEILELFDY